MRHTFSQLQTAGQQATKDTSASTLAILKDNINSSVSFMMAELADYQVQRVQTASTVASQQYYHNPPDLTQIESMTITMGSVTYVLQAIDSYQEWSRLNAITFSGTAIPKFFFQRRDDFGIWPIPQASTHTLTLSYSYRQVEMTADDYATGTVTATENSQTITGAGTTFTAAMANRWFQAQGDKEWYRLSAFSTTTSMSIESAYEGTTGASLTYIIGESPELPPELHELISYRVASLYFGSVRRDPEMSIYWSNMFWNEDPTNASRNFEDAKGGFLGAIKRYAQRSDSRIIRHKQTHRPFDSYLWGVTVSDS